MMKKLKNLVGLPRVYAGVAVLVLSYVTGLSRLNAVLATGLLLVVAGTAGYVWRLRKEGRF